MYNTSPDRREELKLRLRRIMREGRRLMVTSCEQQTLETRISRFFHNEPFFEETYCQFRRNVRRSIHSEIILKPSEFAVIFFKERLRFRAKL